MDKSQSLQDQYAPHSICYGCGPANALGFQLKSTVEGEHVIAHYYPKPAHHAFPGVLNGGVIGTLLDCHCNWAASFYLMQKNALSAPPTVVTSEYTIKLRRPTPMNKRLTLIASLVSIDGHKVVTSAEMFCDNKLCATCDAVFIAVKPDHPAYHRSNT